VKGGTYLRCLHCVARIEIWEAVSMGQVVIPNRPHVAWRRPGLLRRGREERRRGCAGLRPLPCRLVTVAGVGEGHVREEATVEGAIVVSANPAREEHCSGGRLEGRAGSGAPPPARVLHGRRIFEPLHGRPPPR
jgi:hypothetical protein